MNTKAASGKDLAAMTPLEAASYWLVRQDARNLTPDERRELETWLAASEAHRGAYEQVGAMWNDFESSADEGELRALRVTALAAHPVPRVWPLATAIAASAIVAIIGIGSLVWQLSGRFHAAKSGTPPAAGTEYATVHNQRSTVTLSDGTVVSMNIDTAFRTDFGAGRRLIQLTRGQAFFEVARDQRRPFIVAAADRHIQALGTKFDVKLDRDRVEVVLLEGRVSVDRSNPPPPGTGRLTRVELKPDQRLIAAPGGLPSVTATNAVEATRWREGWIVFDDETLEQAIAELSRYSERPILLADDEVRQMRLSGVFRIGRPDRFGDLIRELLPVEVRLGPQGETILMQRQAPPVPARLP